MRDLRADLQDRAHRVEREISAESARFEHLLSQLRAEQDNKLAHLRAQLHLANKLLEFAAWEERVRAALAARVAVAEAVENSINAIASRSRAAPS
jgi:hypothetical protein